MFSKKPFLVSIDDVKEQQYVLLRQAVWNHMEAQQTISTFTVTSVLTFFAIIISLKLQLSFIYLMPITILLPFSYKILNHKLSVSYIAAYQIVCLEDIDNFTQSFTWESDFFLFKRKNYDIKKSTRISKLIDYEFIILGGVSYILYIIYFFNFNINYNTFFDVYNLLGIFFALIFLFFLFLIWKATRGYHLYVNSIDAYIEKWLLFIFREKRIDAETYKKRFVNLLGRLPNDT